MAETLSRTVAAPGRIARNTSVATRLSLVVVLVALVSLVSASVVGLWRGGELADEVLRSRVTSISAARADEVERYMEDLQRAVIGQAISPSTATAINDFAEAYRELQGVEPSAENAVAVDDYYRDTVAPELSAVRGRPVSPASLVPSDPAAVHLQANYVVGSDDDQGLLEDAGDGSRWSAVHRTLQQSFDEFAIQTGVEDFYLIEPLNKVVVYSTAKDIDFAESLVTGPQSGGALAALIKSFGPRPEPGAAVIQDFATYAPAGDAPSAFVASPVIVDGALAGFVAIRVNGDQLSSITTNNGSWDELGDSGETYVIGGDDLMRSDSRSFLEDETSYLATVSELESATPDQIRSMENFATTVIFQPVDVRRGSAAADEEPALTDTTNYLGTAVLQSQRALDIDDLDWTLLTEIGREEIEQPVADFARNLLIAIALFLVAITFVAVRWSDRVLEPLRIISDRLREVRATGDVEAGRSAAVIPERSATEFVQLAGDVDTMLNTLAARNAAATERASERRRLLHRVLPPQAARRAEAGESDVIDQVAHASVAVLVIRGLGELMHTGSTEDARLLLDRFVEEVDAMARQRGLERIRLTGDAYFAACGTVRPHIDHAARAVQFALDVHDLVLDLRYDEHGQVQLGAAVDSGPVTVGLTGGAGLVFDAWGATVQRAADMARRAGPDGVVVSAAVRSQLPSSFLVEGEVVAGRTPDEETVQ